MAGNVLVVVDIQKEYTTPDRPFRIVGIGPSLQMAKRVLEHARHQQWPIYHVQHLQAGSLFNAESPHSKFVDEFKPLAGETVCIKENFSSYSSPEFSSAMARHQDDQIHLIGYGSTMCCLSTIIDGYHRGNKFTFISDASNAKATDMHTEESLHEHATDILRTFCKVVTTAQVIA